MYKKCAKDEVPQVRRIAASTLKDLVKLVPPLSDAELLTAFQEFNKDDQDSVRLMAIDNFIALTHALPTQVREEYEDVVWREVYGGLFEGVCGGQIVASSLYAD